MNIKKKKKIKKKKNDKKKKLELIKQHKDYTFKNIKPDKYNSFYFQTEILTPYDD